VTLNKPGGRHAARYLPKKDGEMFILKSRISNLIEYQKKRARRQARKELKKDIENFKRDQKHNTLIMQKNYDSKLAEYKAIIKRYEERENLIIKRERKLLQDQIEISRASAQLYHHLSVIGETVIKSAHESQGIFERIERMIKIKKD